MPEPSAWIRNSTLYGDPVVCVHINQIVLVLSTAEYKHHSRPTPDDPDGLQRAIHHGIKWVYATIAGHTLSMPESKYDTLIMRGKLYRREQANEARAIRDAARDEARQIKMDWIREEG